MSFIMAILGCGDDGSMCSQQRVEPVRYESAAACEAAVEGVLARNTDIDYPVIEANCRRATPQLAQAEPRAGG